MNDVREYSDAFENLYNTLKDVHEFMVGDFTTSTIKSVQSIQTESKALSDSLLDVTTNPKIINGMSEIFDSSKVSKMSEGVGEVGFAFESISTALGAINPVLSSIQVGITLITTATKQLKTIMNNVFKDYFDFCKDMTNEMNDFYSSIKNANSIFDGFNVQLINAANNGEETVKKINDLQKSMNELAKSGTKMSAEQEEGFKKDYDSLKVYYEKELDLLNQTSDAIQKKAEISVAAGDLSQEQMQRIINDAEKQKDEVIAKITEQYDEEAFLLAKKYTDENGMITKDGEEQLQLLKQNRDKQIQEAHEKCGLVLSTLTNGYAEQLNLQHMTNEEIAEMEEERKKENEKYASELKSIANDTTLSKEESFKRQQEIEKNHNASMIGINDKYYTHFLEASDKEQAVLVAMCLMTETYGGEMDKTTYNYVTDMIHNWNLLPKETKEVMKNALEPMIEEMDKKRTPLFQKAKDLADGILSRLRKTFDINSPSRKTREIFRYLMEGCELGLEDEKAHLLGLVDSVSNSVLDRMYDVGNVDKMFMAKQYHLYSSANSASVSELNRRASAKGIIHTTLNIDGREFAIATSNYMQEELAFKR
ncbi:MAG: hypothetical protein IKY26_10455 [Erysipelotrichaceae bacterium]|nr:hypothetical protein [Erysipelotrichaceae bacterium]